MNRNDLVRAILFDADGVMIFPWRFARYLEHSYGITRETTRPFFTGPFNQCVTGKLDLKEALLPYLSGWGWPGNAEDFVATWLETENAPDARMVAAVKALHREGYLCGLATIQEAYRARFMRTSMGFDELFDRLFFSCDIGFQKPERDYYQEISQTLELDGNQILFWDDNWSFVEGARACGWQARLFTSYEDFQEQMEAMLGIRLESLPGTTST